MSQMKKLGALLSGGAVHRVVRPGGARLTIAGVRLVPFRTALGLLLACIRVKEQSEGSEREVKGKAGPRRAGGARRPGQGGMHHG